MEERAAAARRNTLRRTAQLELLFHLVRVGEQAGKVNPALAGKFHLRSLDATHSSFLISTRQQLALAEANKELLVSLGLSDTVLDELKQVMVEFDEAMVSGRAGRLEHIRARKELFAVADEAGKIIGQLHGLNRYRFRKDPLLLAAWEAVRFIGPKVRAEPKAPAEDPTTPTEGGSTPPPGGVAPAA